MQVGLKVDNKHCLLQHFWENWIEVLLLMCLNVSQAWEIILDAWDQNKFDPQAWDWRA